MEARLFVLSFTLLVSLCHSVKLPASFKKCDRKDLNFNNCLSSAIGNAIKQLSKPFPEYGLPGLEPFASPASLEIGNSTDGIRRVYSNIKLSGLTKIISADARFDFDTNVLSLKVILPELTAEGDIRVEGTLILLPISKSGYITTTLKKATLDTTFFLEEYEQEGIRYYAVKKTDFNAQTEKATFDLKGIFDNKNLNDAFNAELNAKEREVIEDLQKVLINKFGQIFGFFFNNLLKKVPAADLFDGI